MKYAILFYAIFSTIGSDDTTEVISWGLTFSNYQQCEQFYNKNSKNLIDGVEQYAQNTYNKPLHLTELGCAHAISNFDLAIPGNNQNPAKVSRRVPHFTASNI